MKISFRPKHFILTGVTSVLLLTGAAYLGSSFAGKQVSLYKINSGLGICQQRISQTFTALIIKDLGSQYLQNDFKQMTGECLTEVSSMLLAIAPEVSLNNLTNNLKSDLHWFHQKVDRVMEMVQKDNIDLSESNINGKFSELEALGSNLEDAILAKSHSLESTSVLIQIMGALSFILLFLCAGAFLLQRRSLSIQKEQGPILDSDSVHPTLEKESQEEVQLLKTHIQTLEEEKIRLAEIVIELQTERDVPIEDRYIIDNLEELLSPEMALSNTNKKEMANFNSAINTVLDRVQARGFNEGILLQMDHADEFSVYSEQGAIEQLLFSLLSYSMDCLKNVGESKKIKFTSKPLGGIAYCKVAICQYQFTEAERAYLSGTTHETEKMPINLILLRELVDDTGVKLGIKNKLNGQKGTCEAEVEIVFERASEQHVEELITKPEQQTKMIVKGSKSQIREFLDQSLNQSL